MRNKVNHNKRLDHAKTLLLGIVLSAAMLTAPAAAVSYYDITLPSYPPNGTLWNAAGMNDTNQIVGSDDTLTYGDAYLWQNGTFTELPIPSVMGSYAMDINNSGKIVGGESGAINPGVLLDGTTVTSLGTLGGDTSIPYAINETDQIVGTAQTTTSNELVPFFWENGSMQSMGSLGGTSGRAYDINNNGLAVGFSNNGSGHSRAFVWLEGRGMMDLGTLGGDQSEATAVNDANEVVGWSETTSGYQHAFFWKDGIMTDLGTLGGNQSQAFGINNDGLIIGWAETETGYRPMVIWENSIAVRLNQLVAADSGWDLVWPGTTVFSINNNGAILGKGFVNNHEYNFLMIPRQEDFLLHDSDHNGIVNLNDLAKLSSEWIR